MRHVKLRHAKILGLALVALMALGAMSVSSASAALLFFECDKYPCLTEANVTGGKFTIGTTEVTCTGGSFKSEEEKARSETLLLLASYKSCTAFGFVGATVNMNGCDYTFHTVGTADVGPAGCGPIKIEALECEVTVAAQSGLSSVEYINKVEGGKMVVEVKANVKKIKYKIAKGLGTFGCPGEGEEAVYKETTTAKGLSGGAQTGVLVLA
jgi:hypothetical protein